MEIILKEDIIGFVSNIVLYDEHRPHTALFRADHRSQVCIKDIPTSNYHTFHSISLWIFYG